jgi:rubrerythrin
MLFEKVSVAEKQHERRFRGLLESLNNGRTFKRGEPVKWRCMNCGYVHEGPDAPAACPACTHPQAYFELLAENW